MPLTPRSSRRPAALPCSSATPVRSRISYLADVDADGEVDICDNCAALVNAVLGGLGFTSTNRNGPQSVHVAVSDQGVSGGGPGGIPFIILNGFADFEFFISSNP